MEVIIRGEPKEIAALAWELQGRRTMQDVKHVIEEEIKNMPDHPVNLHRQDE